MVLVVGDRTTLGRTCAIARSCTRRCALRFDRRYHRGVLLQVNRLPLPFTSPDAAAVLAEITRLGDVYRRATKRVLPANLLSFSSFGNARNTQYGISLYWTDEQRAEAEWVKQNLTIPSQ